MAFVAVSSLMRTLEFEFLHPQPRVILSNKKQIKSLHEKLGNLLVFLDKFEKNGDNHPEMRAVTERIIAVSVKAEDDIEEELLSDHHHNCLTAINRLDCCCLDFISGFSTSVLQLTASFCPTKLEQTLQRVVDEVEELVQITMNTTDLSNTNLTVGGSSSQHPSRVDEEDAMVGMGDNEMTTFVILKVGVHEEDPIFLHSELDEVMDQLRDDGNKALQVMSMVGMGGIGKTTFAKRIYGHHRIKSHFDKRGWTTMSLEHNKGQAILDLCRCIMPLSSAFNNEMEEDDLKEHLYTSLLGCRYLIIVDDIWTTNAWDDIQTCFPDDNNGSRILLTTRAREIAQYAGSGEYSYDMRFLNQDDSRSLFSWKFLDKEFLNQNHEFDTMGMNIAGKCQGLPLTVVVMAGLLSKINKSIDEWKKIKKNLSSLLALDHHEQFSRIFTLSYNHLPSHLKGCLLYLGVFHEYSEISVKKLIRLWIAEGFVETMSHRKRLEEVGRDYLQDLIDRNLVMVNERSFDGQIKTCKMHDLLHELCKSKAKNENLLYLETTGSKHSFGRFVQLSDQRSILSFKKLRVLDLGKIDFKKGVPQDITDLVFLRYLALASSSSMLLKHIPLDKNWNLQTLIISGEDDKDAQELLPHGIWNNLQQLRHLEINHKLQVSIDLLKVQENLQTLYWLSISQCTGQVFMRIPNVKELGIVAGGHKVSPQGLHNLCFLNYLEKLRVEGSDHPLHLPPFYIFPQSLKELTFVSTRIPWKAMSIISMLPNLEVLKLKKFACTGQVWELTKDGYFPQLKVLIISLTDLKDWKADVEYPFPNLELLKLKWCFELKEMPYFFEYVTTLQLVKFVHCYASLVRSAYPIRKVFVIGSLDVLDFHTRADYHYYEEEDSSE